MNQKIFFNQIPILFALGFCFPFMEQGGEGATVTVDPTAAVVPGSVYNTLLDAVEVHGYQEGIPVGDAWGDGNDDTILLTTNAPHIVPENLDITVLDREPQRSFTIKSAGPGPAVVVGDPLFVKDVKGVFECTRSGTYNFEGITIIGSPTKSGAHEDDGGFRLNGGWKIEADSPGEEVTVNIRDCVVTANDGSNAPILDYSGPFPSGNVGAFIRGAYINDDEFRGQSLKVTVEDSVFAYMIGRSGAEGGGIHFFKTHESANTGATEEVTFRNCLIANCPNASAVTIGGATTGNGLATFEDCLMTNVAGSGLEFTMSPNDAGDEWGNPDVTVIHSILDTPESAIANAPRNQPYSGNLVLDEVTLNCPGRDAILFVDHPTGGGSFDLSDVIAPSVSSLFRLQPDPGPDSGPAPFSLNAASLATNTAVLNTQATSVQATLNGAVVTTEAPAFLDVAFDNDFAGIRRWDSAPNFLFDVSNATYAGLGAGGSDLRGGADFAGGPPPPPTSLVNQWSLYE